MHISILEVTLWLIMASKSGRTLNFSEEEKLLVVELGREFPEMES